MHNKSNLHVFILYINVLISYSFNEFAKKRDVLCAAILEITQDALHVVAARVLTNHFDVFFLLLNIHWFK